MEDLEDQILSDANCCQQCTIRHVWIFKDCQFDQKTRHKFKLHALHCTCPPSGATNPQKTLLMIHGTASTSASFSNCFCHLHQHFDSIWTLDLPGFGRSSVEPAPSGRSWNEFKSMDVFLSAIEALVETQLQGISQLVLCGHSFGTYVASNFAIRHPGLIKHLVLVAPIGMLPTLGSKGFYWAFFFRDLLPLICDAVVANTTEDSDYWHRVLGSRENSWGNRRKAGVGSFVSLSVMHGSSIWNTPVAHRLTELKIPVSCIFAECDGLVPTHQAGVLGCRCEIIGDGAGHASILHGMYAEALCNAIIRMTGQESAMRVPSSLDWKNYASSPITAHTLATISKLYLHIKEERDRLKI